MKQIPNLFKYVFGLNSSPKLNFGSMVSIDRGTLTDLSKDYLALKFLDYVEFSVSTKTIYPLGHLFLTRRKSEEVQDKGSVFRGPQQAQI